MDVVFGMMRGTHGSCTGIVPKFFDARVLGIYVNRFGVCAREVRNM